MRSPDVQQLGMFSYVSVETRVPADHPIRPLRKLVDELLRDLDPVLDRVYADTGRPSIPPERLLRASLLQVIYSIRSERLLMEQLDYNLLFRWFVGLNVDDPVWDHSTFSFNRDRLFSDDIAQHFFESTVLHAIAKDLTSNEHFSVDGTLLEAWASHKSFRPKDGSGDDGDGSDFRGSKRANDTHESTTDPDARLMKKGAGKEAKLSYQATVLMENRNGLAMAVDARIATGTAECEAAIDLAEEMMLGEGQTIGADKGFDTEAFVSKLKARRIKPHVAQNTSGKRGSNVPWQTARSAGYAASQVVRKRIEQIFGWTKVIGGLRKLKCVGLATVKGHVAWVMAAYNLIRIGGLGGWWEAAPT